jgi:hypothetical protein
MRCMASNERRMQLLQLVRALCAPPALRAR